MPTSRLHVPSFNATAHGSSAKNLPPDRTIAAFLASELERTASRETSFLDLEQFRRGIGLTADNIQVQDNGGQGVTLAFTGLNGERLREAKARASAWSQANARNFPGSRTETRIDYADGCKEVEITAPGLFDRLLALAGAGRQK